MADVKMGDMAVQSPAEGTSKLLVLDSTDTSKTVLASVLAAYVIDTLVAAAEITPTAGDAFVVERAGAEGTFSIADAEAWVVDTIEAVGESTMEATDWVIFSDAGVLKKITVQNFFNVSDLTAMSGNIAPAVDEIILQDAGVAKSCTFQVLMDGVANLTPATIATGDGLLIIDSNDSSQARLESIDDIATFMAGTASSTGLSASSGVLSVDLGSLTLFTGPVAPTTDEVYISDAGVDKAATYQVFMNGMANLTAAGEGAVVADKLVYLDLDDGDAKNITVQNLFNVSDLAATVGPIAPADDEIILQDDGVAESCTYQVFMDGVAYLTAGTIATGDSLLFIDSDSSSVAVIETVDDLFGIGPALVTAGTVDMTEDHMLFLDGGATGTAKKCSIQSLFNGVDAIIGGDASLGITGLSSVAASHGGIVAITGGTPPELYNGGAVNIRGGPSIAGATGNGGAFTAAGGASGSTAGDGGAATIAGGVGTTTGAGGAASLTGGGNANGSGNGGAATLAGGATTGTSTGDGGEATLAGGAASGGATGDGGAVTINGGDATTTEGNGGDIAITAGLSTGAVEGGVITVTAGDGGASGAGGTLVMAGGKPASGNAAGGLVSYTGGAGSGTEDGGAASLVGGVAGATGDGGAAYLTGGDSLTGETGTGGAAIIAGGANANTTNGAGGLASVTGGAGKGSGAGGAASLVGGASAGSGQGGNVTLAGGTSGSGIAGGVIIRSDMFFAQDEHTAKATGAQTIAAADFVNGIVVHTLEAASTLTTPTGAEIAAVLPAGVTTGDAFRLHVITVNGEVDDISTLTAGDGDVTFVGNVTVGPDAAGTCGYGTWIFRMTGATSFVGYRVG